MKEGAKYFVDMNGGLNLKITSVTRNRIYYITTHKNGIPGPVGYVPRKSWLDWLMKHEGVVVD